MVSVSSALIIVRYYRWASAPVTQCLTGGSIRLENQPREWVELPAGASVETTFFANDASFPGPTFAAPQGTGSQTFPQALVLDEPYPFTFTARLDTSDGAGPLYSSALTATCTGNGTPDAVIVNWFPFSNPSYYRWAYAPPVECIDLGNSRLLRFAEQPVEWKNLPPMADFETIHSTNGTEFDAGSLPAPDGDGFSVGGPLGVSRVSYPIYYAVRLGTTWGSTARYQSILVGACEANGVGSSRVYNVPEAHAASLALAALGALAGIAARSRRSG
jgi:hypothetical protein